MRIHVIAVSGAGMGPLAGLLSSMGHEVSGSDVAFDPPIGPRLAEWGVSCMQGFSAQHLEHRPDLVVIGNSCRRDNVEARAAIDGGLTYTHIGGALTELVLEGTRPLVVTGTHGKTTTSALAATLLEEVGLEPGFLIGGVPKGLAQSFRAPRARRNLLATAKARPFVIEGDEYDTAFFEKTAKFLHYGAQVVVLTSIEHDHVDIYPTAAAYRAPFAELVAGLPAGGHLVANASDAHVVDLVREHARGPVSWYALEGEDRHGVTAEWVAAPSASASLGRDAPTDHLSSFDLFVGGVPAGRWQTRLIGRHNLSNVLAALAGCVHGYGVDPNRLRAPLMRAGGVALRQELLGRPDGVWLYADFAHHPTAVRETLLAFRAHHPGARLYCVFEPRSATACGPLHQEVYPDGFAHADAVLLAPPGRDLPADARLDSQRLAGEVRARGVEADAFERHADIIDSLVRRVGAGDVVALLSNGRMGGVREDLLEALEARARSAHA